MKLHTSTLILLPFFVSAVWGVFYVGHYAYEIDIDGLPLDEKLHDINNNFVIQIQEITNMPAWINVDKLIYSNGKWDIPTTSGSIAVPPECVGASQLKVRFDVAEGRVTMKQGATTLLEVKGHNNRGTKTWADAPNYVILTFPTGQSLSSTVVTSGETYDGDWTGNMYISGCNIGPVDPFVEPGTYTGSGNSIIGIGIPLHTYDYGERNDKKHTQQKTW